MSHDEWIEEGPIFLTIQRVRGVPLMKELEANIQKMKNDNIIRFQRFAR